ncbi:hypothetical protein PR048_017714 [Dryococelus australis]|uniref:Uncharacterized protein n=1 Tax=Dryococelus australis TaxID=614101 RepID=A0ABQ9HAD9_9NEOP|nr:hypothetical protein PR048_017714 [Dryococelus australis]
MLLWTCLDSARAPLGLVYSVMLGDGWAIVILHAGPLVWLSRWILCPSPATLNDAGVAFKAEDDVDVLRQLMNQLVQKGGFAGRTKGESMPCFSLTPPQLHPQLGRIVGVQSPQGHHSRAGNVLSGTITGSNVVTTSDIVSCSAMHLGYALPRMIFTSASTWCRLYDFDGKLQQLRADVSQGSVQRLYDLRTESEIASRTEGVLHTSSIGPTRHDVLYILVPLPPAKGKKVCRLPTLEALFLSPVMFTAVNRKWENVAAFRHTSPSPLPLSPNHSIPEKTRRPAASSGTIPTCENPEVARPGIEPVSPWWEASVVRLLATHRCERVESSAGPLSDFRKLELCRKMMLIGGFSWGSPVSPARAAFSTACTHLYKRLATHFPQTARERKGGEPGLSPEEIGSSHGAGLEAVSSHAWSTFLARVVMRIPRREVLTSNHAESSEKGIVRGRYFVQTRDVVLISNVRRVFHLGHPLNNEWEMLYTETGVGTSTREKHRLLQRYPADGSLTTTCITQERHLNMSYEDEDSAYDDLVESDSDYEIYELLDMEDPDDGWLTAEDSIFWCIAPAYLEEYYIRMDVTELLDSLWLVPKRVHDALCMAWSCVTERLYNGIPRYFPHVAKIYKGATSPVQLNHPISHLFPSSARKSRSLGEAGRCAGVYTHVATPGVRWKGSKMVSLGLIQLALWRVNKTSECGGRTKWL